MVEKRKGTGRRRLRLEGLVGAAMEKGGGREVRCGGVKGWRDEPDE